MGLIFPPRGPDIPLPPARGPRNRPRAVQGTPHVEKTASVVCRHGICRVRGLVCIGGFWRPRRRAPCRALLGPRPLIDGEDGTNYDVILERISADVAPADFVEEIWVRNVVDLVWESIRLRHLKSQLLHAAAHEGLARVLTPLLDWPSAD